MHPIHIANRGILLRAGHHFSDNLKVCRGVLLQLEINEIQAGMCGSDKASVFPTILRNISAGLRLPPRKSNPKLPKVWKESQKVQLHSSLVDKRRGAFLSERETHFLGFGRG